MDRVDDHRVFAAIVEAQSLQAAAKRLSMSPSSISRHLQKMEAQLGVALLNRTTRSLSLTPQGEIYYASCKRIEDEMRATRHQLQALNAKPLGRLRLTVTPTFNYAQLMAAIADFREDYPDISFALNVSDQHIDLSRDGIDIAIRIGLLQDSRYRARKLMSSCPVPCAAPKYLQAHGKPTKVADLSQHQLVASSHLQAIEKRQTELIPLTLSDAQKVVLADDVIAIYKAVLSGIGISFLPDYLIREDLKKGTLVELLHDIPRSSHDIYALFSNADYLPQKTRIFIDYLVARFDA